MQKYLVRLAIKSFAIVCVATSLLVILNIWILPSIYNGKKRGYVFYPGLIVIFIIVSWIAFSSLPMSSGLRKTFAAIIFGLSASLVVLFLFLLILLNVAGS